MYSRGKSINPEKQEKLDNMAKQFAAGGKKKWVRYDEGALLYSMGIHSFMELLLVKRRSTCITQGRPGERVRATT